MTGAPANAPLLTVTVTNFNYAEFLPQCLDSILGQSWTDFEVLVIDNASTDDSVTVINSYAERDPRIRVIAHRENQGALASQRESCDRARGRYRLHLDADDWILEPTAIESQVSMMETHPDMAFVYSPLTMFGPDGDKILVSCPYTSDVVLDGEVALERVLGFTVNNSGLMLRLDAYHRTAGYPDDMPHIDDLVLAARLCEVGKVGFISRELYAFRQHGSNTHLAPQRDVIRTEILPAIREAFDGPLGDRIEDRERVRRRVVKQALVHLPTQYIFRSQYRAGWSLYRRSLRARPRETLFQPRTIALVLRTALGAQGYEALRRRVSARG
jgi:glycosyltransferase involved in cell wall biosynthesis